MDNFDYMKDLQKQMQKYLQSMEPVSKQLFDAIAANQKYLSKIIMPYQEISAQIEKLKFAISLPDATIDSIKRLSESMTIQLPQYTYALQISTTFLEAVRNSKFIIPEYLIDFKDISFNLCNTTDQLYDSLRTLKDNIAEKMITIDAIPQFLVKPHNSVSAHFNALKVLEFYDYEKNAVIETDIQGLLEEESDIAEQVISKVNIKWVNLLKGAELSFSSKNPEKVRHTITSLRELITQIIHYLAPDSELREKYKDEKWYSNNKLTRKARLHYIQTNRFGNDELLDFIDKDISAILALFDVFQAGTHTVKSNITDEQLKFILIRVKLLITQLLG